MVQLNLCTPIPVDCCTPINHVAFDGCDYFCTIRCKCEIIRFDPRNSALHSYCTCREYDCICYDYLDHCFWASSRECYGMLYKLDCSMNEIDCIKISTDNGIITGISYQCCKDVLIVSFSCAVLQVEKNCEHTKVILTAKGYCIMDVLSICPGMLLTVLMDNKFYILVLDENGEQTACYGIDGPSFPQNLIFNPCMPVCQKAQILAFVRKKNCYPYLCKCSISLSDLGFIPCCCNYKICEECCCDDKPCPDFDACADIMESIALMETALSHILNAEGETIQKVLAETDDIDRIMCVNREVNKTIVYVTHLEHTLYSKLSALCDCGLCGDLCGEGCDMDCGCHSHCCGGQKRQTLFDQLGIV